MQVNQHTQQLLPALIYIQSHLTEDLSLNQVSKEVGLSAFYFHRLFRDTVGETLKQYTQRLRLERAAYHLKIQDASVLTVALEAGFQHHETFSRAFKRWFGVSPRQYRHSFGRALEMDSHNKHEPLNKLTNTYSLSKVRIQKLNPFSVAFIRNLGAYIDVDINKFDKLVEWADQKGFYTGENLLLGVGHDDPNITPVEQVRFDACLTVSEPFLADGEIGFQTILGGDYATASYVGPFNETLEAAYGEMFQQMVQIKKIEIIALPAIEIYRTTKINPDYQLNHTEICLPVRKL